MQHERDLPSWHSYATAGQRFGEAAEIRNHSPTGLHAHWRGAPTFAWRLPLCMAPPSTWRLPLCMAPPSAWRLPLYKAPSSLALAPYAKRPLDSTVIHVGIQTLHGARPSAGRTRPPGTPASPCARRQLHPTHGGLRVPSQPKSQLPHERGVPKETLLPSSSRSCEPPLSTPSALRLGPALKTPIWKSPETFGVITKDQDTHTDSALPAFRSTTRKHRLLLPTVAQSASFILNGCFPTTPPITTKLRRTATRAARSRLSKGQPDPTRSSSKRPRLQ